MQRSFRNSLGQGNRHKLSIRGRAGRDVGVCLSSTDQSDVEWDNLQRRVDDDSRLVHLIAPDSDSDSDSTGSKSCHCRSNENVREIAGERWDRIAELICASVDIQQRFVWDLTLALKLMLVP
jgi:hypothetical protein